MTTSARQTSEQLMMRIKACVREAGLPDAIEALFQDTLEGTRNLSKESHRTITRKPAPNVGASVVSSRKRLQTLLPDGDLLPYIEKVAKANQWRIGWLRTRITGSFSGSRTLVRPPQADTLAARKGRRIAKSLGV